MFRRLINCIDGFEAGGTGVILAIASAAGNIASGK